MKTFTIVAFFAACAVGGIWVGKYYGPRVSAAIAEANNTPEASAKRTAKRDIDALTREVRALNIQLDATLETMREEDNPGYLRAKEACIEEIAEGVRRGMEKSQNK